MQKERMVFLGGTSNGSMWRNEIVPGLSVPYFNPQFTEFSEESAKNTCKYILYVITPKMTGFYSIAEIISDSFDKSKVTIFAYKDEDGGAVFSKHQVKSLIAVGKLMESNGGIWVKEFKDLSTSLNEICV